MTIDNLVPPAQSLKTIPNDGESRQEKQPWQFLSNVLQFGHPDHQLWWDALAPVFGSSLAITGYSLDAQYRHLLKIYAAIIPSLGPFPNAAGTNITWRSAIRPGPMEASVNYQGNGATLYRFTVEPTGPHAGTDVDPANDLAAAQLFQQLSHLQKGDRGVDLSAFGHLRPLLGIDGHEARTHMSAIRSLPRMFHTAVALDLKRDSDASYNVKLYLTPYMRAAILATDVVSLLFDGLRKYRAATGSTVDFGKIEEFMRQHQARLVMDRTYVAVDCVDPLRSRMKIYTETAVTSLAEVHDLWTLGGRVAGPEIDKGFELVRKMWKALYPKPLPNGRQRDSMLVQMNWEISPDMPGRVSPKIYFTVIDDYDRYVSEAVLDLFNELGWSDHIQTHKRVEQEAYPVCHSNPSSTNCYMWIALAYTIKSGPYVTVYTYPSANVARA